MPAITPSSFQPYADTITVTGAVGVGTLIFDGTESIGQGYWWEVTIQNMDDTTDDILEIGFAANSTPFELPIATDERSRLTVKVPPHTRIYANCTATETREVQLIAVPC